MKTKQVKEEPDKSIDEETIVEPKTRARKKATDLNDEDRSKPGHDDPKSSKELKKNASKPKKVVKKRPLGIRKTTTLRGKKVTAAKKNVIRQTVTRTRKAATKTESDSQDKDSVPLIPASEIKKEPVEDTAPNSRSSSPRTTGRRLRHSSDIVIMKSVLGDSPGSLVVGPRTSPYSMRSERSNSPSLFDGKNLRSGKPRKVKNNLLNEVVMKEQKKRRRLLSDSKTDSQEVSEDCKKLKRGRSSSRDGSEISKCSDNTESDISLSETPNDGESKELNKNLDKPKTDLDIDNENNVQISTVGKVPSLSVDSKHTDNKADTEHSSITKAKGKKKLSLKRSTSLDSDNNNSNRLKLENLNVSDLDENLLIKTDTLLEERNNILDSMSKTFNSKEVSKNIRKARRGKKAAAASRINTNQPSKNGISSTITNDLAEDKQDTVDSLSKEISDLINDLDENIDRDQEMTRNDPVVVPDQSQAKPVNQFYGLSKPLGDNNSIVTPDTPVKDKILTIPNECTPSKNDDSENIRLHYEDDSAEKCFENRSEITFKGTTAASIDKLMDRLKEFEEFDKRRQRQESESKSSESKSVMVTNDVVLIPKSGADIKPLKDIQTVRSPERFIEKENVLSCFQNNAAISIVKRDPVRRSIDLDLPNSVTLIKRNSFSARKESTSSNHSRESDAISIFEKSLGKDVTLTEIRKSVDKSAPAPQLDLHQFALLHPPNATQTVAGVVLDSSQVSITPRNIESKLNCNDVQITKRKLSGTLSRKSSDSGLEIDGEKLTSIEKIKSPPHQMRSPAISITPSPVALKSPEATPVALKTPEATPVTLKSPEASPVAVKSPEATLVAVKPPEATLVAVKPPEAILVVFKPTEAIPVTPNSIETTPIALIPLDVAPVALKTAEATPVALKSAEASSVALKTVEATSVSLKTAEATTVALITAESTSVAVKTAESTPVAFDTAEVTSVALKSVKASSVAVKSPEASKIKETVPTVIEAVKSTREEVAWASEVPQVDRKIPDIDKVETNINVKANTVPEKPTEVVAKEDIPMKEIVKEQKADELMKTDIIANTLAKKQSLTEKKQPIVDQIREKHPEAKPEEVKEKSSKVKSARNSIENQPGPSNLLLETPESQKRKESVLRTLGLLTLKAANEEIEKQKQKERMYAKSGKSDYTGTLKTVIKLNRGSGEREKKKYRSSLKITFQKSKNRSGRPQLEVGDTGSDDDAYYTIERREGGAHAATEGGHRKSHYSNRFNNHDTEAVPEPEPKETLNLVIPEKASSFSIHPGRLCMDQCFYCGGKFGLFDTPCHIAQMKSSERQRKVLDNEEKLTIDSCLCDACYRHVDRRANCPSYRKRPPGKPAQSAPPPDTGPEKPLRQEAESEEEEAAKGAAAKGAVGAVVKGVAGPAGKGARGACHTAGCGAPAERCIRRKWLIKMRPSVNRILNLEYDYPGLHTIPLCGEHYRALSPLMSCALCRRRLTKHHSLHFVAHGYAELNPQLAEARIPVQFTEKPVLCKVCRYFCTLLQRPGHNDRHARAYTRKLLQIHNVEIPPELEHGADDSIVLEDCNSTASKQKKKTRTKSKQRKSTDPDKIESESSERTTESSPEKEKSIEHSTDTNTPNPPNVPNIPNVPTKMTQPLEEDIESLISSNKIPVPGAKTAESNPPSDGSETDMISDLEIPRDKQKELRYLLQKQNNPAQFQPNTNLTQKRHNILKIQNFGIQKPGQQHRINEKNVKRIQKLGHIVAHKEKAAQKEDLELLDSSGSEKGKEITFKNISLNDECTIETIPNKKPADVNTLRNKWQSESFTQVKKNISELSKKLTVEKEPKKSETKYSNPVKRLETNPSISVRELFPGEEEMNLQCNVEFNNVKGVTPEGWEKCNSLIQYDAETKKLWTELQRPYGNQSSFLRHLILLEKYFRSGDLVLSHNASPHAANYSSSVHSRLRAYDNVAHETSKKESVSLIEFRKKPSINGKSLLKSNQNSEDTKKFMPPPGNLPKSKPRIEKKAKALPPELIAINTPNAQGRKAIQNVLHNIQQLVKGVSASDPTEIAAAPLPPPKFDAPKEKKEMPGLKFEPHKDKKDASPKTESKEKNESMSVTPKKQKVNSKGWRPTLMPITPENLAKVAREPLKMAVDGHSLPSLVQVVSSGNRYHITFEDYNKMCLIRRERQQRLQEKEAKTKKQPSDDTTVITEIQPSTMLGNGGTVLQTMSLDKDIDRRDMPDLQSATNAATILKNVGLKNITIAPIPAKTATVTSHTHSSSIQSPSILVNTPMKIPHLGPAVTITSETVLTPNLPIMTPSQMILPKIPKSLTVIPQTVIPQMVTQTMTPQTVMANPGFMIPMAAPAPSQAVISERP